MRADGNQGSTLHYEPNSYNEWQEQPEVQEPPLERSGAADRWDFRQDDVNYDEQPGNLFRLMNEEEQQRLFENTARALDGAEEYIQIRHIVNCYKAGPAYGEGVADASGIS